MNELLHLNEMKNAATLLHKSAELLLAPTNAYCVAHPKHRNTVLIDAFGHSHAHAHTNHTVQRSWDHSNHLIKIIAF